MPRRFIAGAHPLTGEQGIWLSKPGIDAGATVTPSNFLLHPSVKFEQVIMAGSVFLPPGGQYTVPYPNSLTKQPYVFFQTSRYDTEIVSPYEDGMQMDHKISATLREFTVGVAINNNNIITSNYNETYNLYVSYMVFHRAIPF